MIAPEVVSFMDYEIGFHAVQQLDQYRNCVKCCNETKIQFFPTTKER